MCVLSTESESFPVINIKPITMPALAFQDFLFNSLRNKEREGNFQMFLSFFKLRK